MGADVEHAVMQSRDVAESDARDRRRSYRIETEVNENPVAAEVETAQGDLISVEVINYSASGLLCYGPADWPVEPSETISRIRLKFARKPDVVFSGEVVRVQKNGERTFCALRFRRDAPVRKPARKRRKQKPALLTDEIKMRWLEKVERLPNYFHAESVEAQIEAERQAYAAFETLTRDFSVEERWWFFEMLDELKRKEPLYPLRLVEEFVLVCEYGYSAIPVHPDWQGKRRGVLRNFFLSVKLFLRRLLGG